MFVRPDLRRSTSTEGWPTSKCCRCEPKGFGPLRFSLHTPIALSPYLSPLAPLHFPYATNSQKIPRVDFGSDDRLVLALARGGPRFGVARSRGGIPHGLPPRRQGLPHDTHGCCAPHGYGGENDDTASGCTSLGLFWCGLLKPTFRCCSARGLCLSSCNELLWSIFQEGGRASVCDRPHPSTPLRLVLSLLKV